jgi:hypothetical protein
VTATDDESTGRRSLGATLKPSRDDLVDAGFLILLGILALVGFRTTYAGANYLLVGVAGLLIGVMIAHLANALKQPVIVVLVMAVAVFFLLGGALALRAQTAAGVLPTVDTTRGLASVSVHGWKQLLTTLPPVDSSGPLLAIPYILGLVGGVGGFTMARRLRSSAVPVIAPAGVLAAVILLGTAKPAAELFQGALFAIVALGWVAVRGLRLRPPVQNGMGQRTRVLTAAALIAVTALGAAVLGPQLPGGGHKRVILRSYVTPPFDISAYPSPLVGFRKFTKDAPNSVSEQTLFTVVGLPAGDYVRIATLDDYNGSVWGATSGTVPTGPTQPLDSFERVGSTIDTDAKGTPVTLQVTIDDAYASSNDLNAWLPVAGSATSVEFAGPNRATHSDQFRYNRGTDQGIVPDRLKMGDSFVVHSVVGSADQADIGDLPATALPFGSPTMASSAYSFTSAQATRWSEGVTGTVPQVLAVAKHLVETGGFSDGGGAESVYLPGHGLARLSGAFLNEKQPVGDDEQFAAAFALLSNQLGLPARVVVGAEPDENGTVRGSDIHTWVEVHLADGSWASVNRRVFMSNNKPQPKVPQTTQDASAAVVPPPNPQHPPSALSQAALDNSASHQTSNSPHGAGWHIPAFMVTIFEWGSPPLLFVSAVCALIVGLKARRRYRRRTIGTATTRVSWGWHELVDHARDLGALLPTGHTRREEARMLETYQVSGLAFAADATVFGPGEPPDENAVEYWRTVDEARRSMSQSVPRWRRWRAALSLRSFRPRTGLSPLSFGHLPPPPAA